MSHITANSQDKRESHEMERESHEMELCDSLTLHSFSKHENQHRTMPTSPLPPLPPPQQSQVEKSKSKAGYIKVRK